MPAYFKKSMVMTPEDARNELTRNHGWLSSTLDVWLRAHGRCEYCKVDLLSSSDLYFHGGHTDHIVPGGGNDLDNMALACAACNRMKRSFDPRSEGPAGATRNDLIGVATRHISDRRARDEERLKWAIPLLHDCGMVRAA